MSCIMTQIVNLRIARKRAARDQAARSAAKNRFAHGISEAERNRLAAARESSARLLDRHKIDAGDRR